MPSIFLQRQTEDFIRDVTSLGSVWFYIVVMIFSLLFNDYLLFGKLAIGLAIIYIVIVILRLVFFKDRPERYRYKTLIDKLDAASFPSNHSARTAFLAILFINYFNNTFISVFLALIALLVLYSRTHLKKHDLKDVCGGLILGIFVYFALETLI